MAETKSKKRSTSKSAGSSSKSKPQSKSKPRSQSKNQSKSKAKSKSSKPKSAKATKAAKPKSSNGAGGGSSPVEAVRNAVGGAGQTVGKVASKAKVPLVAGGAAIAGAAGGMVIAAASKQGRKKGLKSLKAAMPKNPKVKIRSGDLAKAAREVGKVSAQVGEIADGIQRAQDSSNGNGKHRSPVEVVLQGLTARR